jgi:DNA ligase-1
MKMPKLFKPMLAAKPDPAEIDAALAGLPYPALFSPKLDGIRATVQGGRLYMRSLKPVPNKAMQALWGREELDGLDGEIVVGPPTAEDCFNRTTGQVRRVDGSADDAVFWVFDHYSEDEPFVIRHGNAGVTVDSACFAQTIKVVHHTLIKTSKQLAAYEAQVLKAGYEGVMRRSLEGGYKQGRSTLKEQGLIAVKRTVDAEAVIIGTYEQEANGNVAIIGELGQTKRSSHKTGKTGKGTLGGFTVKMFHDGPRHRWPTSEAFNIGTGKGLTNAVRAELWAERTKLPGRIVKFRYQGIGTMNKPRQPIFLGFRDEGDMS